MRVERRGARPDDRRGKPGVCACDAVGVDGAVRRCHASPVDDSEADQFSESDNVADADRFARRENVRAGLLPCDGFG